MELAQALEIMQSIPTKLEQLLQQPDEILQQYGPDNWSAKEYIGHLCDAVGINNERIWMAALGQNPDLPGYEQEELVREGDYHNADLRERVAAAAAGRKETMDFLAGLSAAGWERTGVHPRRGVMTVRELVLLNAEHEQGHINDINRILGHDTVAQPTAEPTPNAVTTALKTIDLAQKLSLFNDHWHPRIIGELNDSHVKIVKVKGEFDWHHHDVEDELFLVLHGHLTIRLQDGQIDLDPGQMAIIPRGVEHQPYAAEETHIMLLEPKTTLNTGNVQTEKTHTELEWI